MGRLNATHPITRFAPELFSEKLDTLGCHLIWRGTMAAGQRRYGCTTKYAQWTTRVDGVPHTHYVSRMVWSIMIGEDLPITMFLVRKASCIHERCVAPGCFDKMTNHDAGVVNNQKRPRAVS